MRFQELLEGDSAVRVDRLQQAVVQCFPDEVRRHGMNFWRPGDPVVGLGVRLLLGVAASYSKHDLELPDEVDSCIQIGGSALTSVDVFDTSAIKAMDEFEKYIPGIGEVLQTPVLGVWMDGILTERAQGFHAKQRILEALGVAR